MVMMMVVIMMTPGRAGGAGRGSWGAAWDHYNQIFSSRNCWTASPWWGGGRRRGRQWREVCGAQEDVLRSEEHEGHQHCQHREGSATYGKIILQFTFNLITIMIMIILEQNISSWSSWNRVYIWSLITIMIILEQSISSWSSWSREYHHDHPGAEYIYDHSSPSSSSLSRVYHHDHSSSSSSS